MSILLHHVLDMPKQLISGPRRTGSSPNQVPCWSHNRVTPASGKPPRQFCCRPVSAVATSAPTPRAESLLQCALRATSLLRPTDHCGPMMSTSILGRSCTMLNTQSSSLSLIRYSPPLPLNTKRQPFISGRTAHNSRATPMSSPPCRFKHIGYRVWRAVESHLLRCNRSPC